MVDTSFFNQGACKGVTNLLFPSGSCGRGRKSRNVEEQEAIQLLCDHCTVTQLCLDYAIMTGQSTGVMGGKTSAELKKLIAEKRTTQYANSRDREY